ncbi:uncharacterized protein LOC119976621 isoform X2 [Scyliorhinus canicula]|uniref:uncharacterized protein LOC119976621 isoform X2 n=1 Tax=Scyliorhinus canicula TaxID=7830 RepID=UPI0018F7828F|nr:uncharacterized protein LOC119976621 isoform X2 [Scyliorhinus canicula]
MKKKKEVTGTICQELTCPACGKLYNNPYLLPCDHSLCDTCLSKEIKHEKRGQISVKCPLCKENFCFSQEDEVKFPENYLLNNTVTRYRREGFNAEKVRKKKRKIKGRISPQQMQILCQLCDEKDNRIAMKKCVNCNLNFCERCLRKIHNNKAFLSHVLIDPSSYIGGQIKCFYHPFTNLKHYCVQDKLPICDECKLSTHRNHRLYSLDLAFQCEVAEMQKNVSQFTEVKANYEKCIQQLKLMKTNIEINEMRQNAELTKEFNSLQEALKLQEQTIKEIMKIENTKKQNEVDNFIESASKLMIKLEGLILYTIEAFKETSPVIFLQTSAQINKRLTESMHCVTPSKSLAVIPFADFELNVDHLRDAINALPLQMCDNDSEYLCSGDFQNIQVVNAPNKMKKMSATCNVQEILPNLHCPSFTSKIHATLSAPNLNLCSYISRSCAAIFNSDEPNADSHANKLFRLCRPKCASESNVTLSSTNLRGQVAYSSLCSPQSTSQMDATSDETDVDSSICVTCSSKYSKPCTPMIDVTSNAPSVTCCQSLSNCDGHTRQYGSEVQVDTNHSLPPSCCSKSDGSIPSGGVYCICIKKHEFMDISSTYCNTNGIDLCNKASNVPMKMECNDRHQESGECQSPLEITKSTCISENKQAISTWQCPQQCSSESVISGDVFTVNLSPKEAHFLNAISSSKTTKSKHPNDHENVDLLKNHHTFSTPSKIMSDSDTGISYPCNSSCWSLERGNGENIEPLYQLNGPCFFTNGEPSQTDSTENRLEHLGKCTCSKSEKNLSSNCHVSEGSSKSQLSNNACNTFSSIRSHGDIGNNLCCKSLDSSTERECSEKNTHSFQNQQHCNSDGYKMDCCRQEMHCLLGTTAYSTKSASFDNADISKPLRFWNTSNALHNSRSRHNFGGRPYCRNPKLLSKSKSFIRSNQKAQTGYSIRSSQPTRCLSQSATNFEVNANAPIKDPVKYHSSNHLYRIGFPKTRNLRNGQRTCSKLRPQNSSHISTGHKNQQHVDTPKKSITLKQENNDLTQISAQRFPNEPVATLRRELSEAPTIYKHTVDGTSAKVKWLFPVEEHTIFFFELQFQEIISVDKEMAIPQFQAGVFSGIRRTNFVATNLNTNSEYLFRVRAVNMTGKGPWSQPYKILTVRGTMHHNTDTKEESVSIKGVKVTIRRSS